VPRTEQFESAYAVVRIDLFQFGDELPSDDWSDHVYVKEVWWTVEGAQAEVARLNSLADEKGGGSRYHWQHVRIRRRP
jgi:hypothetical protein